MNSPTNNFKLSIPYTSIDNNDILDYDYPLDSGIDIFARLSTANRKIFNPDSIEAAGDDFSGVWMDSTNLSCVIHPGCGACISTGLRFNLKALETLYLPAIVKGELVLIEHRVGLQIRTTSDQAFRLRMVVANSPGTIDQSYQSELKVLVWNTDKKKLLIIKDGDRLAQLVVELVPRVDFILRQNAEEEDRGLKGFGSRGAQP
jgi:dUTP pyrophosphatase